MAANLAHYYNFKVAQDVYAVLLMIFVILYFLFAGNFAIFGKANQTLTEEDEQARFIKSGNSLGDSPSSGRTSGAKGRLVPKRNPKNQVI